MSDLADLEAGLSPEELIPGDIAGLDALSTAVSTVADQFASTARGISYIDLSGGAWVGKAADTYDAAREIDIRGFKSAVLILDAVVDAIDSFARTLRQARHLASIAKSDYATAKQKEATAVLTPAPSTPVPTPTQVPMRPASPFATPDPYGINAAVLKLAEARNDVRLAAIPVAQTLNDAAGFAPPPLKVKKSPTGQGGPSFSDIVHSPLDLFGGFGKAIGGALTSMPDWLSPPGAPTYGSGGQGERDAQDGIDQMNKGDLTMLDAGLLFAGVRAGSPFVDRKALSDFLSRTLRRSLSEDAVSTPYRPTPFPRLWKMTEFKGNRVYQRDDLIDPTQVAPDGRTNEQRMEAGLAPYGLDGKKINLHHLLQQHHGPIAEVTSTMHTGWSKVLHINGKDVESGIDRRAFDAWRKAYWQHRADDFGG